MTELAYRLSDGMGSTRIALTEHALVAGSPARGYRERTIPLANIVGFCVEKMPFAGNTLSGRIFNADFIVVFRDERKHVAYRLAVNDSAPAFHEVMSALGRRCPAGDLTSLPVADALARLQVPSQLVETLKVLALFAIGLGLIAVLVAVAVIRR